VGPCGGTLLHFKRNIFRYEVLVRSDRDGQASLSIAKPLRSFCESMMKLPIWLSAPVAMVTLMAALSCGPADDAGAVAQESEAELVQRSRGIHDRVITLDTHNDIDTSDFTAERNYTSDLDTQVNLPKMEAGGLDVAWFIVYTGQAEFGQEPGEPGVSDG